MFFRANDAASYKFNFNSIYLSFLWINLLKIQFRYIWSISLCVNISRDLVSLTFFFTNDIFDLSLYNCYACFSGTSNISQKLSEYSVQTSSIISFAEFSSSINYFCLYRIAYWSAYFYFKIWIKNGAGSKFGLRN